MIMGQQLIVRLSVAVRMRGAFRRALKHDSGTGDTVMVAGVEYLRDEAEAALMALEAEIGAQPDEERIAVGLLPIALCSQARACA